MNPLNWRRTWRTVRHLRGKQLRAQLRKRASVAPTIQFSDQPAPELRAKHPAAGFLGAPAHAFFDGAHYFRLLNREVRFPEQIDWDIESQGKLWSYHLHQFHHVRRSDLRAEARARLMLDWIERHTSGMGWNSDPLSYRSINWIKFLITPGALPRDLHVQAAIRDSLGLQLDTLAQNLETHLMANHLFANLAALVCAGLAFEGDRADAWLAHSDALRGELRQQILADGAHEERTPMYHSMLLELVLDLVNVASAVPQRAPAELVEELRRTAARMLGALEVWTHPDEQIALFGDSAFGIAPEPSELQRYASALEISAKAPGKSGVLEAAGYVQLQQAPFCLIASVGGPGPAHQPGHAHCDALAFELSVERERVVTDSGVAEYLPGTLRDLSRATRSHATVEVAGHDQAEIWAAHRIGGRPRVQLIGVEPHGRAEATCASWCTRRTQHRRIFQVSTSAVEIHDRFEGRARPVRYAFPLAPQIEAQIDGERAGLRTPRGTRIAIDLPSSLEWSLEDGLYMPEFGRTLERQVLVGRAAKPQSTTVRFRLG